MSTLGQPTLLAPQAPATAQTLRSQPGAYGQMMHPHMDWLRIIIILIVYYIIIFIVMVLFNFPQFQYKDAAGQPNGSPNYGAIALGTLIFVIITAILAWVLCMFGKKW